MNYGTSAIKYIIVFFLGFVIGCISYFLVSEKLYSVGENYVENCALFCKAIGLNEYYVDKYGNCYCKQSFVGIDRRSNVAYNITRWVNYGKIEKIEKTQIIYVPVNTTQR